MSRRRVPVVVAAVLLSLAAAAGLAAFEAWRWTAHASAEDRRLARELVPAGAWAERGGFAADVLGAADDVAFRRAIVQFRRGRGDFFGGEKTIEQVVSSVEAGIGLAAVARGDAPAERRSAALNLLAILTGEVAVFENDSETRIRAAATQLRQAIRLNPANDAAKANLELLLRLTGGGDTPVEGTGGFGGLGEDAAAGAGGSGY